MSWKKKTKEFWRFVSSKLLLGSASGLTTWSLRLTQTSSACIGYVSWISFKCRPAELTTIAGSGDIGRESSNLTPFYAIYRTKIPCFDSGIEFTWMAMVGNTLPDWRMYWSSQPGPRLPRQAGKNPRPRGELTWWYWLAPAMETALCRFSREFGVKATGFCWRVQNSFAVQSSNWLLTSSCMHSSCKKRRCARLISGWRPRQLDRR